MQKQTRTQNLLQPTPRRLLRVIASLMLALGVGIAIFWGNHAGKSFFGSGSTSADAGLSTASEAVFDNGATLVAYSVDYGMDQARIEKTVEHYGEGIQPIVEDVPKLNEQNPNSKPAAENSFKRESTLNEMLPEDNGESFSKQDLLDMESNSDR